MVLMPVSKLRRVRRLAFSNISTICLASSAWRYSRGIALDVVAELENGAHLGAGEIGDGAQILAGHARGRGKNVGVLMDGNSGSSLRSMSSFASHGWLSFLGGRLCAGAACSVKNFVERGDGGVHMLALKDVRRQEAQHRVAGAVDDDVPLEHLGDGELGQIGGVELGGNHQALAAHVDDACVLLGECAQFCWK